MPLLSREAYRVECSPGGANVHPVRHQDDNRDKVCVMDRPEFVYKQGIDTVKGFRKGGGRAEKQEEKCYQ